MNDLRDLVEPLLDDPPHPAPPLEELQARVHRRRQRRARTIGACSIVAVVLVAAAVLSFPRDADLQVGGGEITAAGTVGTSAPPTDVDVTVFVNPEVGPLQGVRRFEIRNTSDQPFPLDCGGRLDIVRWNGLDESWTWYGTLAPAADPPYLLEAMTVGATPCQDDPVVAAGGTFTVDLDLSTVVRTNGGGTIPADQQPLEPGAYRFGPSFIATSPLIVGGQFEITAPDGRADPAGR